jgi:hypothetical protein
MRLRAAALPPIALAVVLMAPGGCGTTGKSDTSKFSGDDKAVAQAVYDLRDAVAARDEAKICDTYLTPGLRNQLAALARQDKRGLTCADQLKTSIQDVDSTDITVTAVKIDPAHPGTATATITTKVQKGPRPTDTLTLANERGWRLAKLP